MNDRSLTGIDSQERGEQEKTSKNKYRRNDAFKIRQTKQNKTKENHKHAKTLFTYAKEHISPYIHICAFCMQTDLNMGDTEFHLSGSRYVRVGLNNTRA